MRRIIIALMFFSSFSPIFITSFFTKSYDLFSHNKSIILSNNSYIPNVNLCFELYLKNISILLYFFLGIAGCLSTFYFVRCIRTKSEVLLFSPTKVESFDPVVIGYFLSYFSPIISKFTSFSLSTIIFISFSIFIFCFCIKSMQIIPVLRVAGFRFYKAESSAKVVYVLITKREIRNVKQIKKVYKISESMIMEAT